MQIVSVIPNPLLISFHDLKKIIPKTAPATKEEEEKKQSSKHPVQTKTLVTEQRKIPSWPKVNLQQNCKVIQNDESLSRTFQETSNEELAADDGEIPGEGRRRQQATELGFYKN